MVVMLIQNFDSGPFNASETRASAAPTVLSPPDNQGQDKGLNGDNNEGGLAATTAAPAPAPGGPVKQYEGIDGENMLWTEAYQVTPPPSSHSYINPCIQLAFVCR